MAETENEKPLEVEVEPITTSDSEQESKQNKPTEEEIQQFKKEFEEAATSFSTKEFTLAEEDPEKYVSYLQHFLRNRFLWTKNAWLGCMKLSEELDKISNNLLSKETTKFTLGYQALEFVFYMLENPSGIGLESALNFEKENVEFGLCYEATSKALQEAREELKLIQWKQERWGSSEMGHYLAPLEPKEDQTVTDEYQATPNIEETTPTEN